MLGSLAVVWSVIIGIRVRGDKPVASSCISVVVAVFLVAMVGIFLNSFRENVYQRDPLTVAAHQHRQVNAKGWVGQRFVKPGSHLVLWEIEDIEVDGKRSAETVCLVDYEEELKAVPQGSEISFFGVAKTSRLSGQCTTTVKAEKVEIVHPPHFTDRAINTVRLRFIEVLTNIQQPPDVSALLQGIIVGDDSKISTELREQMKILSLSHLTAVSGTHISIVLALVFAGVGRRKPWITAVITLCVVSVMVIIVGGSASVIRAFVMSVFVLIGIALQRARDAIPILATTIMIICLMDPNLAREIGFALSVAATFAIVSFGHVLSSTLAVRFPQWFTQMIAIPLVASLGTLPIIIAIQPELSVWSVLANLLISPVITPLTIFGLASLVITNIHALLAIPLVWISSWGCYWIIAVVNLLKGLPGSHCSPTIVFLLYLVFAILIFYNQRLTQLKRTLVHRYLPHKNSLIVLRGLSIRLDRVFRGGILVAIFFVCGIISLPIETRSSNWEIIQCDVGQGSAAVLRRESQIVVVDVGPTPESIRRCLMDNRINVIDVLVLSHFDLDHVGGLDGLLGTVKVKEVWVSANRNPLKNSNRALGLIHAKDIPITEVRNSVELRGWIRAFHPSKLAGSADDSNRDSIVVEAKTDSLSVLILSDIPKESQDTLAQTIQGVDVVVVSHHGSKDQSESLAKKTAPKISLVSVGENDYGHPTARAREIWDAPLYLTTQKCGEIRIGKDGVEASCQGME